MWQRDSSLSFLTSFTSSLLISSTLNPQLHEKSKYKKRTLSRITPDNWGAILSEFQKKDSKRYKQRFLYTISQNRISSWVLAVPSEQEPILTARLIAIAKRCRQANSPLKDGWINKMWFIHTTHTMEYCSALKRKEILTYATIWMNYGDVSCELPDVQAGFRKARGNRSNCNICWIIKKAREYQKNIYFCFID